MVRFILAGVLLLLVVGLATATTPADWATSHPGYFIPSCNATGPTHWEVIASTVQEQTAAWDAFKSKGYSKLQLHFQDGYFILGADCAVAT